MRDILTTSRIAGTLALLVAMAPGASAQMFVTTGRDTLRGLPGVEVEVESLEQDIERDGLTVAAIHTDVEQRLRAAGITVYTSQRANPSDAKAYLYVHVNSVKLPAQGLYAIDLQVHVRQTLKSLVTASNIVDAMTWDQTNVVVVREEIQSFVDQFIQDWMAVHR
jgi:hypothetical protein